MDRRPHVKVLAFSSAQIANEHMVEPKTPSAGKTRAPLVPAVARINVTEPYSVREWSNKYGCTTEQLRAAVTAVGNVAADVENTSSLLAIPVPIAPRSEKHST
jgi:hypothetical protein